LFVDCTEDGINMMPSAPLVLVVEDDVDVHTMLCTYLMEAGYRVAAANERSVGAAILRNTLPALLIADVALRGGNGEDLAKLARPMGVSVLLISGEPGAMKKYLEDHSIPFLQKPFKLVELQREIDRLLVKG
jgi:DNA-binding response OmpR family regulator